jgi:hypothetical protein
MLPRLKNNAFPPDKTACFLALEMEGFRKGAAMNADIDRVRAIFIEAVGKVPPEQWEAFVAEKCGADAALH